MLLHPFHYLGVTVPASVAQWGGAPSVFGIWIAVLCLNQAFDHLSRTKSDSRPEHVLFVYHPDSLNLASIYLSVLVSILHVPVSVSQSQCLSLDLIVDLLFSVSCSQDSLSDCLQQQPGAEASFHRSLLCEDLPPDE